MDLTAWFGPHGVFSTGDAAHIFGSGSVPLVGTTPGVPGEELMTGYRMFMK